MTETKEPSQKFLGTYFDRDVVMRLSRWAQVASWVVLAVYLITWLITVTQFLIQYSSGMFYNKGMTIFDSLNFFTPYLTQPIPGILYFFSLQAIAHLLIIFLDIEENTRRAARK
ncbi:MAG: hypothetical protein MUO77_14920 [Anaerolineales bacterium]|nr:hypothetical protein [Anaerolineales bacterium]